MKWTTVSANWHSGSGAMVEKTDTVAAADMPGHAEETEGLTISCYENGIPPFIDFAMDRLYGSIFSSLKQFRVYHGSWEGTHTYVVRRGMKIEAAFLFRCENGVVRVLNEVITLDGEQIDRFAQYVFHRFRNADVVCFKSIRTEPRRFSYPFQRFNFSEDIVLSLPPTADEYHARLGKNTRRNIKRYGDKLQRNFPSYAFHAYEQADVIERHVRDIIALNHARMAEKNKTSMIDERETQNILALAKKCGLVGVVSIDGKVRAGTIGYWVGEHFYLSVIAHDPAYDEYWLGILCCYHTIRECIARRAREFHFLWGRYEYKFTLLAVRRDLDVLMLYRSPWQMLRHAGLYAKTASGGWRRKLNLWLHDAARHDTFMVRAAVKLLNWGRASTNVLKNFASGKVRHGTAEDGQARSGSIGQ